MAARIIVVDGSEYVSRYFPREITTFRVDDAMHFVDSDPRIAEVRAEEFLHSNRDRLPVTAEFSIEYV